MDTERAQERCPACAEPAAAGSRFCEGCGTALSGGGADAEPGAEVEPATAPTAVVPTPPAPDWGSFGEASSAVVRICASCGGTVATDGYCLECGERAPDPRDHFREAPSALLGGVCDRGVVHTRNEDALALAHAVGPGTSPRGGTALAVVCDGVSSAPDSDVASLAGARAALLAAQHALATAHPGAPRSGVLTAAVVAGAAAAHAAVIASVGAGHDEANPPSCTYVASACEPGTIATAWIGDSRAYWLPADGEAVQLTTDHSWANEMIDLGMSQQEALSAPNGHAITRWLGADAPAEAPATVVIHPDVPGTVLVCSDGLWNYCPEPAQLGALVAQMTQRHGPAPVEVAEALVRWACEQGGRDNITAALIRVDSLEQMNPEGKATDGNL